MLSQIVQMVASAQRSRCRLFREWLTSGGGRPVVPTVSVMHPSLVYRRSNATLWPCLIGRRECVDYCLSCAWVWRSALCQSMVGVGRALRAVPLIRDAEALEADGESRAQWFRW